MDLPARPDTSGTALSYDDVLLEPQRSPVSSRADVDTSTHITPNVSVDVPIISANMSTVTEQRMAQAMVNVGAIGIIHRFLSPGEQARVIEGVNGPVGASVGINGSFVENAEQYIAAGADFLCLDVAHGHMNDTLEAVESLRQRFPAVDIMAGNVATPAGAKDLIQAGANSIKVGVGSGSACITREVTGVGVPQLTAVHNVATALRASDTSAPSDANLPGSGEAVTIIADGGIQTPGDMVKALMAGANAVMVGGYLAGCEETPGDTITVDGETYKEYHGMASRKARDSRPDADDDVHQRSVEGASTLTKVNGTVEQTVTDAVQGIRSGLSYCGGHTIQNARENAEFVSITPSTQERNGVHSVDLVTEK